MKNKIFTNLIILTFFSLIMLTVSAENNSEIVLKDGRVLKNPYIISRTPSGLNVGHENGVIFVPFSKMSKKRQEQYNYSPKKSKKYKKKIAKAQHKRQVRIAEKRALAKNADSGFNYRAERFPEQSNSSHLKNELAELIREKSRLEREHRRVSAGRLSPKSGPSDDIYVSYRGGKVYRKRRTNYAKQQTKNINTQKRRLKEINSSIQRNVRRTTTVRNLISRSQIGGIKHGRTVKNY